MPAGYYHALLSGPAALPWSVDMYGTTHFTSAVITLPTSSVIPNGACPAEFTIECWIKVLVSRGNQGVVFGTGSSALDVTMIQAASNGVLGMFGANQSTFAPTLNTWTHIAYVRSVAGSYQRWLVNGVQHDNTANSTFSRTITTTVRKIGSDGAGDTFPGRLSDLRVWTVARTNAQILAAYNTRLTGSESGLAGYWKLKEGTGIIVADSTAGAANGTFNNGPGGDILWAADSPTFI
jgi:hypothetical protein